MVRYGARPFKLAFPTASGDSNAPGFRGELKWSASVDEYGAGTVVLFFTGLVPQPMVVCHMEDLPANRLGEETRFVFNMRTAGVERHLPLGFGSGNGDGDEEAILVSVRPGRLLLVGGCAILCLLLLDPSEEQCGDHRSRTSA